MFNSFNTEIEGKSYSHGNNLSVPEHIGRERIDIMWTGNTL